MLEDNYNGPTLYNNENLKYLMEKSHVTLLSN